MMQGKDGGLTALSPTPLQPHRRIWRHRPARAAAAALLPLLLFVTPGSCSESFPIVLWKKALDGSGRLYSRALLRGAGLAYQGGSLLGAAVWTAASDGSLHAIDTATGAGATEQSDNSGWGNRGSIGTEAFVPRAVDGRNTSCYVAPTIAGRGGDGGADVLVHAVVDEDAGG
eukprot:CAMPEP_0194288320 /NCGR_PEP_ID=MMETSP0169-20130528/36558_1 /TAXON_ID=218684 /ORGANISM="Corethron pennatum, Strain L29A3" /LENGTH=171 /DNA_ID=CAMNT_0039035287 /DNA_START=270 /DNA_END=781 /DNA_ORIENTATION=-